MPFMALLLWAGSQGRLPLGNEPGDGGMVPL
jgi:hypothetical protein